MQDQLSCVEKRPMSEFPLTAMGCMVSAQPVATEFVREHPAYHLSSFRCEIDHPAEKQT
jgi:hypothetical protein